MIVLQNTQQYPIHIGSGLEGFTVPAMGRVSVETMPKLVAGIVVVSTPKKPVKQARQVK